MAPIITSTPFFGIIENRGAQGAALGNESQVPLSRHLAGKRGVDPDFRIGIDNPKAIRSDQRLESSQISKYAGRLYNIGERIRLESSLFLRRQESPTEDPPICNIFPKSM